MILQSGLRWLLACAVAAVFSGVRPALAQQAAAGDSAQQLQEIEVQGSVSGKGKDRGGNDVDSLLLRAAPPGTSALKVVEQLPGVNMQSSDPFGLYEWSNRVTIRGFQTQQIGQVFDGVPLGDMSYGNFNGLGVGRAVDPENLNAASVTQGSGALGTASANNLGGVIQYASAEPGNAAGGEFRQMVGSASARRTYLRLNSGIHPLGENGFFKGFVSYSRLDTDKWKGGGARFSDFPGDHGFLFGQGGLFGTGQQWQDQLNTKLAFLFGANRITVFYDYSDRKESDYMDLSLQVFDNAVPGIQTGPRFDYFSSWAEAQQYGQLAAQGSPLGDVAYYYSAQGARLDHLGYVAGDFAIGSRTHVLIEPYFHLDRGGGDWHAPSYGASYSPDPVMFRQTQYHINRGGGVARVTTQFAVGGYQNRLEGGVWLENNSTNIRRPRWRLTDYANSPSVDFSDVLRLDFDRHGDITTSQLYLRNTTLLAQERLRVSYGAKYVRVGADFTNNGNTATDGVVASLFADATRPAFSLPTPGKVLPQVGMVFSATEGEELFANYSENVNQFPYSPSTGVYNTDPSIWTFLKDNARAERSTTFDLGVRTRRKGLEAGLTGYHVSYRNRLLPVSLCPPTVTCATGIGNVGSVTSLGLEALLTVTPLPAFTWFTSAAYNKSTFNDDYLANALDPSSLVPTKGKDVQDAPRVLLGSSIRFTRQGLSASFGGRYVDKRFFTYTNGLDDPNDAKGSVPSYTLFDASAGYTFDRAGPLHALSIQLNTLNLFDKDYVSTIGSNGFGTVGDNQTLLTGPGRLVFVSIGTAF